ncbi:hypothetical protein EIP86_004154 [Pleurotus ostreatoroseus]|nr:hypothetical protein EIP86_004154 [Pleurotus ostreatoroseus]
MASHCAPGDSRSLVLDPRLPPELVLHVFEHADRATLITCSTICRQWSAMSMPYRFYSVALQCTTSEDDEEASPLLPGFSIFLFKRLPQFLQFLRQSPHIAHEIHELLIEIVTQRSFANLDQSAFANVLCSLPQLRTLALVNVFLRAPDPELLTGVNINHLIVRYPGMRWYDIVVDINHLWGMLALFGDVSSVSFEDMHVVAKTPLSSLRKPNVTALTLRRVTGIPSLLESMTASGSPRLPGLRSIDIPDPICVQIPALNAFLRGTGAQYSYLGCSMPYSVTRMGRSSEGKNHKRLIAVLLIQH